MPLTEKKKESTFFFRFQEARSFFTHFFSQKLRKTGEKLKSQKNRKNHIKNQKRVPKIKKQNSERAHRARHVAAVVARSQLTPSECLEAALFN